MDILSSLAIVTLAGLVHASFQLSVSVLTLLSGHTIGAKRSHARLLRLTSSFVFGTGLMTMLLLSFVSLVLLNFFGNHAPQLIWAVACGLMIGVAIAIWAFYYRHEKGTTLWVPRSMADYLTKRTKSTTLSGEAFGLGISSVVGEILFIIAPLFISALVLIQLPAVWQLVGVSIYTLVSMLSIITVWVMIGSGHALSDIQRWRENNKHFIQFTAGTGLIILGFFVYVYQVLGTSVGVS